MLGNLDMDFLTIPEAAKLLRMSTATLRRWIRQGRLPAYHVGPRKVRIRRQDLNKVVAPASGEDVSAMKESKPISTTFVVKPLTDEQVQRGLEALQEARELGQRILARTGGKPLSSSAPLIRKARAERSKQLL